MKVKSRLITAAVMGATMLVFGSMQLFARPLPSYRLQPVVIDK